MPGRSGGERKPPKPERVYGGTAITLAPGDPLPVGTYVKGWKLDTSVYGPDRLYIVYTPEEQKG